MANDSVFDNTVALLNSIRYYDKEVSVLIIPYDDRCKKIKNLLEYYENVDFYPDISFVDKLSDDIKSIFGKGLFARPNQFRKQACWFGHFEKFIYLDVDIVVFEKMSKNFRYFDKYDFINCDYHWLKGIKYLFKQSILDEKVIGKKDIKKVFNAGFWGAKKSVFSSKEDLLDFFKECKEQIKHFDFSTKVSDMPVFNYLVIKKIKKKLNLITLKENKAGNWAGSSNLEGKGSFVVDSNCNQKPKFLHWAGIKIAPGCP